VIFCSASAKSGISTVLQLLQFGISVCLCNCFGISSSLQFLQFGILVKFLQKKKWSDILSSVYAKSGISTFLQLLQFGISVLSLQLFWYFFFSLVSVIWYLRSVSAKIK